jgi:hypothetical protein
MRRAWRLGAFPRKIGIQSEASSFPPRVQRPCCSMASNYPKLAAKYSERVDSQCELVETVTVPGLHIASPGVSVISITSASVRTYSQLVYIQLDPRTLALRTVYLIKMIDLVYCKPHPRSVLLIPHVSVVVDLHWPPR